MKFIVEYNMNASGMIQGTITAIPDPKFSSNVFIPEGLANDNVCISDGRQNKWHSRYYPTITEAEEIVALALQELRQQITKRAERLAQACPTAYEVEI